MPPQKNKETRENRLPETLDAYKTGYFHSINENARTFDVSASSLSRQTAKVTPTKREGLTTADFQRQTDKLLRLLEKGTPLSVSQQKKVGKVILSVGKYVLDGFILRNQLEELHTAIVEKAKRKT